MILSYRISTRQLETDQQFARLVGFLQEHRTVIDELSLFTEFWHHGCYPLDRFAAWAAVLAQRLAQLCQQGF